MDCRKSLIRIRASWRRRHTCSPQVSSEFHRIRRARIRRFLQPNYTSPPSVSVSQPGTVLCSGTIFSLWCRSQIGPSPYCTCPDSSALPTRISWPHPGIILLFLEKKNQQKSWLRRYDERWEDYDAHLVSLFSFRMIFGANRVGVLLLYYGKGSIKSSSPHLCLQEYTPSRTIPGIPWFLAAENIFDDDFSLQFGMTVLLPREIPSYLPRFGWAIRSWPIFAIFLSTSSLTRTS